MSPKFSKMRGGTIHNIRVGIGPHFHNISSSFTLFHVDPEAPTSFAGLIGHGITVGLDIIEKWNSSEGGE